MRRRRSHSAERERGGRARRLPPARDAVCGRRIRRRRKRSAQRPNVGLHVETGRQVLLRALPVRVGRRCAKPRTCAGGHRRRARGCRARRGIGAFWGAAAAEGRGDGGAPPRADVVVARGLRSLCSDWQTAGVLDALARLARCEAASEEPVQTWLIDGDLHEVASARGVRAAHIAAARVQCGAQLEARAVRACAASPSAQLYFDAYATAVWTSAHAQYLSLEAAGLAPPAPSIHSVFCAASECDTSYLFERSAHSKNVLTKEGGALARLLARCTNPGSRGWEAAVRDALGDCGSRNFLAHLMLTCLTGLHPHLHPAKRPDWPTRLRIAHVASVTLASKEAAVQCAHQAKEAMRRHVSSMMGAIPATHAALNTARHPVQRLGAPPPQQIPPAAMLAAMTAFCRAGKRLTVVAEAPTDQPLATLLRAEFDALERTWRAGWVGKGTMTAPPTLRLLRANEMLCHASFRGNFSTFWATACAHQLRPLRLDPARYEAIHALSRTTQLANAVPMASALAAQRKALRTPWAGILSVGDAVTLLTGRVSAPTATAAFDASAALRAIGANGAHTAAQLFLFARVATLMEHILVVQLDADTRAQQVLALRRRANCSGGDGDDNAMPLHCTHLAVCLQCRRVANAHVIVDESKSPLPFTEFGVSACQLCVGTDGDANEPTRLQCGKRPSAALRNATEFQKVIECLRINECPQGDTLLEHVQNTNGNLRRDCNTAFRQPSTNVFCSQGQMVNIPIKGRAIRLFGAWYSLCSFCAVPMKINFGRNWHSGYLCCMRCAHPVATPTAAASQTSSPPTPVVAELAPMAPRCRYCGVLQTKTTAAAWRCVPAPLDIAGTNNQLPAPLRTVHYCRAHHRTWLRAAHRVLESRVILAHLANNARPLFHECGVDHAMVDDPNGTGLGAERADTAHTRPNPRRSPKRRRIR